MESHNHQPSAFENPWITESSENVYDNAWINVKEHKVINPSGGKGIYGVVTFKNLAIGIVALDADHNTFLVGQYRYPINEYSWEIPEGGGPIGVDPLLSAQRELKEETGLIAQKWTLIQRIHTSNSVCNEEGFIYLAEDLVQSESEPEETEQLLLKKVHLKEALNLVMENKITDSLSIAGILKAARLKGY